MGCKYTAKTGISDRLSALRGSDYTNEHPFSLFFVNPLGRFGVYLRQFAELNPTIEKVPDNNKLAGFFTGFKSPESRTGNYCGEPDG